MNFCIIIGGIVQVVSIFGAFAGSRKWWWAPILGTLNQGLWITYSLSGPAEVRVLLPATIVYTVINASAIRKWYRERPRRAPL